MYCKLPESITPPPRKVDFKFPAPPPLKQILNPIFAAHLLLFIDKVEGLIGWIFSCSGKGVAGKHVDNIISLMQSPNAIPCLINSEKAFLCTQIYNLFAQFAPPLLLLSWLAGTWRKYFQLLHHLNTSLQIIGENAGTAENNGNIDLTLVCSGGSLDQALSSDELFWNAQIHSLTQWCTCCSIDTLSQVRPKFLSDEMLLIHEHVDAKVTHLLKAPRTSSLLMSQKQGREFLYLVPMDEHKKKEGMTLCWKTNLRSYLWFF